MEQLVESIFPEKEVVYAKFWPRFGAAFCDGFFVFMAWFIVGLSSKSSFAGILDILIALLYHPIMEASPIQASVGKRGLGIKVTDLDGNRISYGRAFGRHLGKLISTAILFIGYFMMLWTDKHQTLHDRMAGTLVVADKPQ